MGFQYRFFTLISRQSGDNTIYIAITMVFTRHVEVGRVILITYGPDTGKLATIIDIVDQNKCLIDGPVEITGVHRQVVSFKRLTLTNFKLNIQVNARSNSLKKAWKQDDIETKWQNTNLAKKMTAKMKKDNLTDFQRFQIMEVRKEKRFNN